MKLLVIGSKGFIGTHCVDYFAKEYDVWECDVVTDYTTKNYYQIDATNANFNELFQIHTFDICINCSGAASVPNSIKNPQHDFFLNTVNVFNQLDAIRKKSAQCKYINLSSAAVYGNPQSLPIEEEHPLMPISPYGIHKKMAEEICASFYNNYNIKSCTLRIFSAYGDGLKKQLFWDLYEKSKNQKTVSLYGTGNETRDFIHISDVVRAIDVIIKKADFENNIFNVASGIENSIEYVVKTFFKQYKPNIKIEFQGQNRKGDPKNWVANIAKLESLGFSSKINIEEGLKIYKEWLIEQE
jgi:dTDP-glucose 4,6-dehydratase/UDP-glucose 4-epimerase